MLLYALFKLESINLDEQRSAIKLLEESGDDNAIRPLIKLVKCHHTDQHSRIIAINAVEKLTGQEIKNMPEVKCKFVDRYIARRALEEN